MTTLFRNVALSAAMLALSACSSGPPVPDWKLNAHSAQERAISAYLSGKDSVAQSELARARLEVGSTGKMALALRIELAHCAAQVAALVLESCPGFERLRADASAADIAYLHYLSGQRADAALLPEQHRAVAAALATGNEVGAATAVAAMADPLSRLVAAGAALRAGQATPAVLTAAVETASDQGWRRALLAWLQAQALRAEKAGDLEAAAQVRRRMALVTESKPGQPGPDTRAPDP